MIITDFSKVVYAFVFVMADDIKKSSPDEIENIIRHGAINSFMTLSKRFKKEYGELIIAYDGGKNFRKDIYPNYKASRNDFREKSDLPWNIIFDVMTKLRDEAKDNWCWSIVGTEKTEADDVMAVLIEDVANKNVKSVGLLDEEECEKVLLDTRDTDMYQVHYPNVKQWDSRDRKFIGLPKGMTKEDFKKDLIIRGDGTDGVENIFTPLNTIITPGKRQVACIAKRVNSILKYENIFDYDEDPTIKQRIKENYQLVCFDGIPIHYRDMILEAYNNRTKHSKMKMLKYLNEKKCFKLAEYIEEM